ncbi:MAG: RNA-binding protein [Gammaproteobacteria bacterium]|nr:RNA-binding protein [Gammaproteobacteria bacterium]
MSTQQSKIYVGNLSYKSTNEDLLEYFRQYGGVLEARIISDRATGQSKGFGFVTFDGPESAQAALAANGQDFAGRNLKVSIANDDNRSSGGGNGNRGGSRGGFGGGNRGGHHGGHKGGF